MRLSAGHRAAGPATARTLNDRLALELLLEHGPLTATQLAGLTGLSRPTVAELIRRLLHAELIAVVGESGAVRRGPNARMYGLAASRAHLAALDVRMDGITVAVADLTGRVVATADLSTADLSTTDLTTAERDTDADAVVSRALAVLDETVRGSGATELHTVAVGAPGLVDPLTGVLAPPPGHPSWPPVLAAELRGRGHSLLLENEVNLAGVAEQRLGSARDRDSFVLLWLGQGVGAATVLDGRLRRGVSGGAGELGFLPVPGTSTLPSAGGCSGGFHSLVSGSAVLELAARYDLVPADPARPGSPAEDAATLVAGTVRSGTRDASAFLDAFARRIALGVSAVCVVLDPGCVVLGGDIGRAGGAELAERVAEELTGLSPLRTEVRPSTVSGNVVIQGGVLVASDAVRSDLFPG